METTVEQISATTEIVRGELPAWIQLLPAGKFETRDGRGPYNAKDLKAIVAETKARSANGEFVIDYNHGTDLFAKIGAMAPAAGWVTEFDIRADGIWGKVEWTPEGGRAVSEREYRFISPVIVQDAKKSVVAMLRASLTNDPNLTMIALNHREKGTAMDQDEFLMALGKALSIDEPTPEAVLEAVKKLTTAAQCSDPSKFAPIELLKQARDEIARIKKGVSLQAAQRRVSSAVENGEIMPFMAEWAVELCMLDPEAFDRFVNGPGEGVKNFTQDLMKPAFPSYEDAERRSSRGRHHVDEISSRLGLSDDDLKKFAPSQKR